MSIGDLFGDDLKTLFGGDVIDPGEPADLAELEVQGDVQVSALDVQEIGPEDTVHSIVVELSKLQPNEVVLDADLADDLGITGLALWAVVAEVERKTGAKFPDVEVLAWRTPRDIVDAARSAAPQ